MANEPVPQKIESKTKPPPPPYAHTRTDGARGLGDVGGIGAGEDPLEALVCPEEVVAEEEVRDGEVLEAEEEAGRGWSGGRGGGGG